MTAFAFSNIGMLAALAVLPVIWYFLRLMPPKPRLERFPPTRLLLEIARKDEQPATSPWWLTALRLLLAAIVIFALAGPVFKPTAEVAPGSGPLLIVVDNGWQAAPNWTATIDTAHRIVKLAEEAGRPISLLATAEAANQSLEPADSGEILKRLDALQPRPWAPQRADLATALAGVAAKTPFGGVVWLSDGVGGPDADAFARFLGETSKEPVVVYADTASPLMGLKPPVSGADALTVPVIRRAAPDAAAGIVTARDIKGRVIGDAPFTFAANETSAQAKITLPIEIRNEIARLEISRSQTAGAVQLLDDRFRRRRVGLLSGASVEAAQPLLSPLYYISRAVQPFADVREPRNANAAVAVPELIDANCSVIAMADIGNLTSGVEEQVSRWVESGGVLVRFAGPRLAAATDCADPGDAAPRRPHARRQPHLADAAAAGELLRQEPLRRAEGARRRDRDPPGAGRAGRRARQPHLGGACRRHAAGHRRPARQGLADPLPRHRRYQLVEPAAVGHLRRNAQADRRLFLRGRRRREDRRRIPAGRPLSPARWLRPLRHAGRRSPAAFRRRRRGRSEHPASARPLRHRGRLPRAEPARRQGRASRPRSRAPCSGSACAPIRRQSPPSWRPGCSPWRSSCWRWMRWRCCG